MAFSGEIVSQLRRSKGLTQEELAEHIGVSRQTIAMWEIHKRLPTDSVAILTARFLGLDEEELLSLLRNERLRLHVERLQDQYGATIIIADAPNHGGIAMRHPEYTAYQSQQGVHFAVTHIHKSIGFEYPEKLMQLKGEGGFDAPFETSRPGEYLIIKVVAQSEDESFIPNWHYVNYFEIIDDLGNRFWPMGMGLRATVPSEASGGSFTEGYARFDYAPEARSISFRQIISNARKEDCDLVAFEDVKLTDHGISKGIDDLTITYEGVEVTEIRDPQNHRKIDQINQIHIRLQERANPRYIGVYDVTDNLGNEHQVHGWSWNLESKTEEGFSLKGLSPEAKSISFKYLIARTFLEFQFSDIPIPS